MKHYKGFPYIKVGHFYKLQFKDAKAIAYCAYEDKFIIKSGSTAAFDCPDVNEYDPNHCQERIACDLRDRMCIANCIGQFTDGVLFVNADYDKANPYEAAQILTSLDNVDPPKLWVNIFD